MDKYDVNFKRLALLLLPTFWRRPLFAAMAYAAVSPLQYLHTRFILWKRESDYRLEHNGQVCYLRALLNDKFRLRRWAESNSPLAPSDADGNAANPTHRSIRHHPVRNKPIFFMDE